MTTLHLTQHDVDAISAGAEGSCLIDLTEHGQRTIVSDALRSFGVLAPDVEGGAMLASRLADSPVQRGALLFGGRRG
jgi:hypothetical protein